MLSATRACDSHKWKGHTAYCITRSPHFITGVPIALAGQGALRHDPVTDSAIGRRLYGPGAAGVGGGGGVSRGWTEENAAIPVPPRTRVSGV